MHGQAIGYMNFNGEKVLVLCRASGWKRYFKMRDSGDDGVHFSDEEGYLVERPEVVSLLLSGESVCVQ